MNVKLANGSDFQTTRFIGINERTFHRKMKCNRAIQSDRFLPPPKQWHTKRMLNKITSSTLELFLTRLWCNNWKTKWKSRLLRHMSAFHISSKVAFSLDVQVSWRNYDYADRLIITFLQLPPSSKPPWQPFSTCGETAGSSALATRVWSKVASDT